MMAEGFTRSRKEKSWSLDCSICLDRFRNPKTLPCLHSYCEGCLIDYTKPGAKTIKCPQCKEDAPVPEGDASKFKSNFHLKELVEEANLRDQIVYPSTKLICNCCDEELDAVSRCVDCDQYLCTSCLKAHNRFPALRDHVVASLEEIRVGKVRPRSNQKRQLMCIKHPGNKAEIFCITCEKPICHICATLKHKSPDHECVETIEATEGRKQVVLEGLKRLDEKVKKEFRNVTTKTEKVRDHALKLKEHINLVCKEKMLRLKQEKEDLIEELDCLLHSDIQRLDKCMETIETRTHQKQSIQEAVTMTLEEGSDGDFLYLYDTVRTKIDQLSLKKYNAVQTQTDSRTFTKSNELSVALGKLTSMEQLNMLKMTLLNEYNMKDNSKHEFYGIDSFGETIAVTDKESEKVVLLDSTQLREEVIIDCNKANVKTPSGVVFFLAGLFVVVIDQSNKATIYNREGRVVTQFDIKLSQVADPLQKTFSIAVDSEDNFTFGITTEQGYRWLLRNKYKSTVTDDDSLRIAQTPAFLTFTRNEEHLLVSDMLAGTVTCLGKKGAHEFHLDIKSAGQDSPTGVCCDEDGFIYVASIATSDGKKVSSVHRYTPNGGHAEFLGDFSHPIYGMTFTKDGNLAAACGDSVKIFSIIKVD